MPTTYYHRNIRVYKPSNSRYVGFGVVVVFHVLLAYFLVETLNHRNVETLPQDVKIAQVDEVKPKEDLPPPPPPKFDVPPPPPFVPPVEVNVAAPAVVTNAIQQVTNKVAPPAPPPPKVEAHTNIDLKHVPDTDAYYPPISKRLSEEGVVMMQIACAPDGRVVDAKVGKSSGYTRLDTAGVALSRAGGLRCLPFQGDQPVWTTFNVRFQLR